MRKLIQPVAILLLPALLLSCKGEKKVEETKEAEVVVEEAKEKSLVKVWETDTLLTTSESVLFDEANEVLYVSNIGAVPPSAQDGDGFISKVALSGEILELKWVEGIDAPKGMGLLNGKLYVADIDELVEIDIASGTIANKYLIEGSAFLNDITVSDDSTVYISDSDTNKIFSFKNGESSVWMEGDIFGRPNGLLFQGEKMMQANFASGVLNTIDMATKELTMLNDSLPGGDGIKAVGDDYLISSWHGQVYYVTGDGTRSTLLDTSADTLNCADIEFIAETSILYVPTFFGNTVAAYELK